MQFPFKPKTNRLACALLFMASGVPLVHAQEADPNASPALCSSGDNPEAGIQGDANAGTVNCGLTLLSTVEPGGHAQGSGNCAYLRTSGGAPYTGDRLLAFDLSDPRNPRQTGDVESMGASESIRAVTAGDRAVLVSGNAVYDISEGDCSLDNFKGEINWPSANYEAGAVVAATSGHEIAISHDAKRVYTGLGFVVADISDLDHSETWTIKNWTCEMNAQSAFYFGGQPPMCDEFSPPDYPRQYSHSSDDNLEGTRWYGANQAGDSIPELGTQPEQLHQLTDTGAQQAEVPTARIVDISDHPNSITILDTLDYFPGHSMAWWRTPDGREFIVGANENIGQPADSCQSYPRPVSLGNSLDAYIAEVTGGQFDREKYTAYRANPGLTLAINRPENCEVAPDNTPKITEYSLYNKNGAAMLMVEYGSAGIRLFDLRDGDKPKEVAYFNDGKGHVHSGVFYYNDQNGTLVTSGSEVMHVLELQPQVIQALGLPCPTDPEYPRGTSGARPQACVTRGGPAGEPGKPAGSPGGSSRSSGGSWSGSALGFFLLILLARTLGHRRQAQGLRRP